MSFDLSYEMQKFIDNKNALMESLFCLNFDNVKFLSMYTISAVLRICLCFEHKGVGLCANDEQSITEQVKCELHIKWDLTVSN